MIGSLVFSGLYESTNSIYSPMIFGSAICILSWICGIFLNVMDKMADKQEGKLEIKRSEEDGINFSDLKLLKLDFWLICFSCNLTYIGFFCFLSNL